MNPRSGDSDDKRASSDNANEYVTGDAGSNSGPRASLDPFEAKVKAALDASAAQHRPASNLEQRAHSPTTSSAGRRPSRWLLAAAAVVMIVIGSAVARRDTGQTVSMLPPAGETVGTPPLIPATTAPATNGPPARESAKVLRSDGIDGIRFGESSAAAEQTISTLVGPAIGRFTDPTCSVRQVITWGSFAIWDHQGAFTNWLLVGDAGLGLQMEQGVGIWSTEPDLVRAYPEVTVGEVEDDPLRRVITTATPNGAATWVAVLDAQDRTISMAAGDDSAWSDECPTSDVSGLDLEPHPAGLGIVMFGTPADRSNAVMVAVYGSATGGSATDAAGCGDVVTTRYGAAPHVSVIVTHEKFVGYRLPPASGLLPRVLIDSRDRTLTTGTSIGEVRATYGDRVEIATMTDDTGSRVLRIRSEAGDFPDLVADATGPLDADTLTTVGVQAPLC